MYYGFTLDLVFKKLILHKVFENRLKRFFSLKRNSKPFLIFNFLLLFLIFDISKAGTNFSDTKNNQIGIQYLDSRNELEDYIIDTGDAIYLEFYPAEELNGIFPVNNEGELLLPLFDETFVRGLTKSELKTLLEKKYSEFLIDPDIKVKIVVFKSIRVLVSGELRNPGFYKFPSYRSSSVINLDKEKSLASNLELKENFSKKNEEVEFEVRRISELDYQSFRNIEVKNSNENAITISDVIRKAGGITSQTDLSRIEIIRDVPLGKGGGKKIASIDFNSYINKSDFSKDIRIFDGDSLFFPKLTKANPKQIPNSVLSGISPKFISVNLFGRVQTPGPVRLPLEASLSDAIDLTGPIKPLSGKIVLLRYEPDGTLTKKKISYSAAARRGSERNPYLRDDDLISVRNSVFGKTTNFIKEFTAPFLGIYTTKKLIEDFNE